MSLNTFEEAIVDVVDGFLHVFISQLYPNPNPVQIEPRPQIEFAPPFLQQY